MRDEDFDPKDFGDLVSSAPSWQKPVQHELFDPNPYYKHNPGPSESQKLAEDQELLRTGRPVVRAPSKAMPGILSKGQFLTQHDTNTTRGAYNPNFRSEWEQDAGFERPPVYGTYQQGGGEAVDPDADPARQYGEHYFTLSEETRDRARVLHGDSLGSETYPEPVTDLMEDKDPIPELDVSQYVFHVPYTETQVEPREGEKGVPLSDVASARIDITPPGNWDWTEYNHQPAKLGYARDLQRQGIPTKVTEETISYQPPLPYTDEELTAGGLDPVAPGTAYSMNLPRSVRPDKETLWQSKSQSPFHRSRKARSLTEYEERGWK